MSAQLWTLLGVIVTAIASIVGYFLIDRRNARSKEIDLLISREKIMSDAAKERAEDHMELTKRQRELEADMVKRAEERVESVLRPIIEYERSARRSLESDMVVLRGDNQRVREELASMRRELAVVMAARCDRPDCPVYRPFPSNT